MTLTHERPGTGIVQQFEYGLDAPICLTWELTYACNLECAHCLPSSGRRDPRELATAQCEAVIDELQRMQVFYVNIGGGEPTIRPDFWHLLEYSVDHQVGVKFSTNGVRITPEGARFLASIDYVDVQIYLDGATAEVNDYVRGPGSYNTALRALQNLQEAGSRDANILENDFDAATNLLEDISGDYILDAAHTRIGFSARHAMVTTVRGQFKDFEGTAHIDTANPGASSVTVTIQTASIDTGVMDRDGHLKSADFFDAEASPVITFVSTDVSRDGDDWTITGDLTIKGVAKPVSIGFESTGSARDPYDNLRVGFEGGTTINRKDWGLSWNAALENGGVLVSEKVKLDFDISAIRSATA